MAFISITYNEGSAKADMEYLAVCLRFGNDTKVFETGNFVKDWYDMRKFIITQLPMEQYNVHSSSVDHFIMDGAPYDSAYLHMIDGKPVLKYFDHSKANWYDEEGIGDGIEFFVPENTQPTWEELKEICEIKDTNYFIALHKTHCNESEAHIKIIKANYNTGEIKPIDL